MILKKYMVHKISNFFLKLFQSYLFIIVIALVAALVYPQHVVVLSDYATFFLQVIFFLTCLKLNPKDFFSELRNVKLIILASLFMLLILPSVVYLFASWFVPSLAVGLLLLASMPTGMTAPLLTEVVGGKPGTSLVLAVITSILAPFTIPFIISVFVSTSVSVSSVAMFWSLVKVIVIPFVLGQLTRMYLQKVIKPAKPFFKPTSLVLLGLLIAGVTAKQADAILMQVGSSILVDITVLTLFIAFLLFVGYFIAFWKTEKDRLTVAVSVTFMNFTLAIYLSGLYFNDPKVALICVLVIFPWSLLLIPFEKIVHKFIPV